MKFLREMIAKKVEDNEDSVEEEAISDSAMAETAEVDPSTDLDVDANSNENQTESEVMVLGSENEVTAVQAEKPSASTAKVNIWDMDDEGDDSSSPAAEEAHTAEPPAEKADTRDSVVIPSPVLRPKSKRRPGRVKTRILGFEHSNGVVDLFDPNAVVKSAMAAKFPVGWVVVIDGPGRGESFALLSGLSQIGRGADQQIQLDFGDSSISRNNHAAIAYDAESHKFFLGHGGKSNIVRLNDVPVLSTEALKTGDVVNIGETKLRFAAFCGEDFDWDGKDSQGGDDDIAIA